MVKNKVGNKVKNKIRNKDKNKDKNKVKNIEKNNIENVEEEKKKSVVIPTIILVCTFILGTILYTNLTEEASIIKKYFDRINSKDYEGAYELVDTTMSKEEFISKIKNIYDGIEAKDISVKIVGKTFDFKKENEESEETRVTYNTSMETVAGNINYINTTNIKKVDGKYVIDWKITDIYPELKENDKILVKTINSKRGNIYDRNNKLLASEEKAYSIGIVPGKTDSTTDYSKIAELLNVDEKSVREQIKKDYVTDNTFVELGKISRDEQDTKNNLLNIKGIMVTDTTVRTYQYKEATSSITGYVQNDNGKAGLESSFNDILKGKEGKEIYIDRNSTKVKTISKIEKQDGKDIKTTIDVELQLKIYEQFKEDEGAQVAINYKTGEVLALISTPCYDANKFSYGITNNEWEKIQNDIKKPLFNRYLATYAPGSSFKPLIAAIGIQNNIFTKSEDFGKSGRKWQLDNSWKDFFVTTLKEYNETANLENALVYSDNIYFAKASLKIGKEKLKNELDRFGFNKKMKFALDIMDSSYGALDSDKQIANTGYGQAEVMVNPLKMASIYSAFANKGKMVEPYIIYEEKSENKNKYYDENIIDEEVADTVKDALIQVVKRGNAKNANIEGKIIAGKTGTAEIKESQSDKNVKEIGWFNSFDDNELLIVAMCENVQNKGESSYVVNKVAEIYK